MALISLMMTKAFVNVPSVGMISRGFSSGAGRGLDSSTLRNLLPLKPPKKEKKSLITGMTKFVLLWKSSKTSVPETGV